MSLTGQLSNVIDKTQKLISRCEDLEVENELLQLDNQSLTVAVNTSKAKIAELEEKLRALKLARSLEEIAVAKGDSSEKALDMKQKISEFVREIDKCIVLLKK